MEIKIGELTVFRDEFFKTHHDNVSHCPEITKN